MAKQPVKFIITFVIATLLITGGIFYYMKRGDNSIPEITPQEGTTTPPPLETPAPTPSPTPEPKQIRQIVTSAKLEVESAIKTGQEESNNIKGICPDGKGGAWVAGEFDRNIVFDKTHLTSTDITDMFVAHYTPQGTWGKAKAISGTLFEKIYGICESDEGGCFILGKFKGKLILGTTELAESDTLISFVLLLDANLELVVLQSLENITFNHVIPDEKGGCIISAIVTGQTNIGAYTLSPATNRSDRQLALLHIDHEGTWQNAETYGKGASYIANPSCLGENDELWLAGVASSPAGFRKKDLILHKIGADNFGKILTNYLTITGGLDLASLAPGRDNSVWVAGKFQGTTEIGGKEIFSQGSSYNHFLFNMSESGAALNTLNMGEGSGYCLLENGTGGVFYGGMFQNKLFTDAGNVESTADTSGILIYINSNGKVLDYIAMTGGQRHAVYSIIRVSADTYCIAGTFLGDATIGNFPISTGKFSQSFVARIKVTQTIEGYTEETDAPVDEAKPRDTISFGLDASDFVSFNASGKNEISNLLLDEKGNVVFSGIYQSPDAFRSLHLQSDHNMFIASMDGDFNSSRVFSWFSDQIEGRIKPSWLTPCGNGDYWIAGNHSKKLVMKDQTFIPKPQQQRAFLSLISKNSEKVITRTTDAESELIKAHPGIDGSCLVVLKNGSQPNKFADLELEQGSHYLCSFDPNGNGVKAIKYEGADYLNVTTSGSGNVVARTTTANALLSKVDTTDTAFTHKLFSVEDGSEILEFTSPIEDKLNAFCGGSETSVWIFGSIANGDPAQLINYNWKTRISTEVEGSYTPLLLKPDREGGLWCFGRMNKKTDTIIGGIALSKEGGTHFIARITAAGTCLGALTMFLDEDGEVTDIVAVDSNNCKIAVKYSVYANLGSETLKSTGNANTFLATISLIDL